MSKLPILIRIFVLPFGSCAPATLITWKLWPFIQPSASSLCLIATLLSAFTTAYLFMTPRFSVAIDHRDIFRLYCLRSSSAADELDRPSTEPGRGRAAASRCGARKSRGGNGG